MGESDVAHPGRLQRSAQLAVAGVAGPIAVVLVVLAIRGRWRAFFLTLLLGAAATLGATVAVRQMEHRLRGRQGEAPSEEQPGAPSAGAPAAAGS